MKCEKCESENVKIVTHTVNVKKSCGGLFVTFAILGFIVLVVGVVFFISAYKSIENNIIFFDKEQMTLRENLTECNQKLIIGFILIFSGMIDFLVLILFKSVSPSASTTQIIGVCLDCGATWVIPVKLKEFNEDEVYQAKLKRKELKNSEENEDKQEKQ